MTRKLFFLIDDDADDQEIFCMALRQIDPSITCITARDGAEGIQHLQNDTSFQPDLIFIDINMPRLNGMECLKQIRERNLAPRAKIVMYSTTLEDYIIHQARLLGADDFLIKPTSLAELEKKLVQQINAS